MNPQPHPLRCETCDHYNGGEYFDKCKNEIFPDNMDSTERQYIKDWISSHGCASHSAASRPAPAPGEMAFKDSIIEQQKIHIKVLNEKMAEMMQGAAAQAREKALNDVREALSHIRFQDEDMWFIEAAINKIESLRHTEAQQ